MNDLKCPACGSNNVTLEMDTVMLSEPYGGEGSVELYNYICGQCDFQGDILNQNDEIIIAKLESLKLIAVQNIIEYFESIHINMPTLERILGLPQRSLATCKSGEANPDPSTVTLLKCVRTFPWLLAVAENKFDPNISKETLIDMAIKETIDLKKSSEKRK